MSVRPRHAPALAPRLPPARRLADPGAVEDPRRRDPHLPLDLIRAEVGYRFVVEGSVVQVETSRGSGERQVFGLSRPGGGRVEVTRPQLLQGQRDGRLVCLF